jgi:hypothetical protein
MFVVIATSWMLATWRDGGTKKHGTSMEEDRGRRGVRTLSLRRDSLKGREVRAMGAVAGVELVSSDMVVDLSGQAIVF